MIILNPDSLNWVSFREVPLNCKFITRDLTTVYKIYSSRNYIVNERGTKVDLADTTDVAVVEEITAWVAKKA